MADFDIGSILNSLSPEDIENIKKTAESFLCGSLNMSGDKKQEEQQKQKQNPIPSGEGFPGFGMPDLSQLASIAPLLQAFNAHDDRLDFINALKPLLSQERRHKADEAMKLVKLLSVLPLLRERGIM